MSAFNVQEGGDHYRKLNIQPAEFCMANNIPYVEGSVIKYVSRWRAKGGVEDLRKARHFLDMLIERTERDTQTTDMFQEPSDYIKELVAQRCTLDTRGIGEKGYENGN